MARKEYFFQNAEISDFFFSLLVDVGSFGSDLLIPHDQLRSSTQNRANQQIRLAFYFGPKRVFRPKCRNFRFFSPLSRRGWFWFVLGLWYRGRWEWKEAKRLIGTDEWWGNDRELYWVWLWICVLEEGKSYIGFGWQSIVKGKGRTSGFRKVLLRFFFFLNCADVENCGSFRGFGYIYIYRWYDMIYGISSKLDWCLVGVLDILVS